LKGDSLLKKISFLRDSSKLSFNEQIKALSPYETAIATCPYDHDSVHVQLLQRIGKLLCSVSSFSKAVSYYERSIDLVKRKSTSHSVNPKDIVVGYYGLSSCYDSLHRITDKMRALDSCAFNAIKLRYITNYCLWALYQRAEYSFNIGDYHRCITYADLCESLATDLVRRGSKQEVDIGIYYASRIWVWNVNALTMLKRLDEAKNFLEKKADEYKDKRLEHDLGIIYGTLAEVFEMKGDFEKLLFYQNKAFALAKKAGDEFNCKAMLNYIGYQIWFKHYKNPDKALEYYRRALQVNDKRYQALSSMESLSILDRMANVFTMKKQYAEALKNIQLAFDQIQQGSTETDVLHSSLDDFMKQKRLGYIATLIVDKAITYHEKYKITNDLNDLKEAIRIYKVADQFLERIKTEQSDVKSKLFWRSDRRRLYELAIEACNAYGNSVDAFYFFERSRAVLLYDELNQLRLMGEEDVSRQVLLKKSVARLEVELSRQGKSSDQARALQEQLVVYKQELDQLNEQIDARNPGFYQHLSQTDQINVSDVQHKLLKGNDRLLEFFEGDSAVYTMIISPSQVLLEKINKDTFDQVVSQFISYISSYDQLNKNFGEFVNVSNRLYQLIFEHHDLADGKLIVSFDGHYFPIEALVTKKGLPPAYLIQNHAVSYAHSARLLMIDFSKEPGQSGKSFLGFAPVNFQAKFNMPSLIGSDVSLQVLRSNFQNTNCMAFKAASKNSFLRNFPAYQVIQLYTHASDSGNAGEPEIYFADSVLRLSELMSEKKPFAKLIVLSACETGTGQLYRGEGVFSFNRGFAALGIPSSVSNLWSVDNVSTYHLTELFYKYLARGLPFDDALQKAKLEFIEESPREKSLPYYWAATILAGKTDAIDFTTSYGWKKITLIAVFGCVLVFAFGLWIRKKKMRG